MTLYRWRDGFAMKDEEIEADVVTFESAHVVFWRADHTVAGGLVLLHARRNEYVDKLWPVES